MKWNEDQMLKLLIRVTIRNCKLHRLTTGMDFYTKDHKEDFLESHSLLMLVGSYICSNQLLTPELREQIKTEINLNNEILYQIKT